MSSLPPRVEGGRGRGLADLDLVEAVEQADDHVNGGARRRPPLDGEFQPGEGEQLMERLVAERFAGGGWHGSLLFLGNVTNPTMPDLGPSRPGTAPSPARRPPEDLVAEPLEQEDDPVVLHPH